MLFGYAPSALRYAILLFLIHLNPVVFFLPRPKEYFSFVQMIQSGSLIKIFNPPAVYITSALLDEPPRFSLG